MSYFSVHVLFYNCNFSMYRSTSFVCYPFVCSECLNRGTRMAPERTEALRPPRKAGYAREGICRLRKRSGRASPLQLLGACGFADRWHLPQPFMVPQSAASCSSLTDPCAGAAKICVFGDRSILSGDTVAACRPHVLSAGAGIQVDSELPLHVEVADIENLAGDPPHSLQVACTRRISRHIIA